MQNWGCTHCFAIQNWGCMHCFPHQDAFKCRVGVAGVALHPEIGLACIALQTRMVLHTDWGLQALLYIPKLGLHALLCTQGWLCTQNGGCRRCFAHRMGVACVALCPRMVLHAELGLHALLCILKLGLHALLCTPGWF